MKAEHKTCRDEFLGAQQVLQQHALQTQTAAQRWQQVRERPVAAGPAG